VDFLPLHFNLRGAPVLLVGGGEIARRKAVLISEAGAVLMCVAPTLEFDLRALSAHHAWREKTFEAADVVGMRLVVAATDDALVNERVSLAAQAQNLPVNVVDQPSLSTVIFPAIVNRSPVLLSVGTGGSSPVLTRYLREQLEALVPQSLVRVATYLKSRRPRLKAAIPDIRTRRITTEAFFAGPGFSHAEAGEDDLADGYLFEPSQGFGEVFLVGAGPGDPDLLTLKALQLLQRADVILYDNLVSAKVLDRARRDATFEYVGKQSGLNSTPQNSINARLVTLARQGLRVVRLKGGDPFIFGRGGEELAELIEAGIAFQVVPGITAASGCAAYAGIPLTHRDYAQSVRFVTGHPKNASVDLPWHEMVSPGQTLVFYMGLGGLSDICTQLIRHGKAVETPIAVISKGTTPESVSVMGDLETAPGLVARAQLPSPTLIIVGEVLRAPSVRPLLAKAID
jgi:uroporphyrin-III C-methyltransferase/precorrin-2 dehydrogenase/sirohydrochlorin ferrochelatase